MDLALLCPHMPLTLTKVWLIFICITFKPPGFGFTEKQGDKLKQNYFILDYHKYVGKKQKENFFDKHSLCRIHKTI